MLNRWPGTLVIACLFFRVSMEFGGVGSNIMVKQFARTGAHFVLKIVFKVLALIIPKNPRIWLFYSSPVYADNSKAVADFIRKEYPEINAVWLIGNNGGSSAEQLGSIGYTSTRINSLRGIYYLLRGKVFITSHSIPSYRNTRGQFYCNMWHGMPFKSAGVYSPGWDSYQIKRFMKSASRVDLMIATSSLTRAGQSMQFSVPPQKFVITGQPRTDSLFDTSRRARCFINKKFNLTSQSRVIGMLPTFREGDWYQLYDGVPLHIQFNDPEGLAQLNETLVSHNAHLVIKPHPFDLAKLQTLQLGGNVHLLEDNSLRENDIDVYHFLAECDALITDYSSVYLDYLIMNRPIMFFVKDFEEYTRSRRFVFEPYDFWTPGPKSKSFSELSSHLGSILSGHDSHVSERAMIRELIHTYTDGNATARLVGEIIERANLQFHAQ